MERGQRIIYFRETERERERERERSVSFNDAVNCYVYVASLIDETRAWNIARGLMREENDSIR